MDKLPVELVRRTMEQVGPKHLLALRLVNKCFADIATPLLFSTLRFYGPGHIDWLSNDPDPVPVKTAEFRKLHDAVPEVLRVAGACRKLVFAPAFYREGFWDDYREYLQAQLDEPVHETDFEYRDDGEDDDEDRDDYEAENDYDAMYQAVIDRRIARVAEEMESVNKAEEQWGRMISDQTANAGLVASSLKNLLARMSALNEIIILPWEFEGFEELGFHSWELDLRHDGASPTAHFLHVLAQALYAADRHIEKLHVQACTPQLLETSPAMHHAFTGLRHLRLDMHRVDALLEDAPVSQVLPGLFKHARPTLERLELVSGGKWPQLPSWGVHELGKILADEEPNRLISFPKLRYFHLGSFLISTTSLHDFIVTQPKLSTLEFSYVYLVTEGKGWAWLATRLPDAVKAWSAFGRVGHEPTLVADKPIAYNWCKEWRPDQNPLPAETGWKAEPSGFNCFKLRRISSFGE